MAEHPVGSTLQIIILIVGVWGESMYMCVCVCVCVCVCGEGGVYLTHGCLQSLCGLLSCEPQGHHHDNALFTGGGATRGGGGGGLWLGRLERCREV